MVLTCFSIDIYYKRVTLQQTYHTSGMSHISTCPVLVLPSLYHWSFFPTQLTFLYWKDAVSLVHMRPVKKVSDLWPGKIHLHTWRSATLIPFEVVSLWLNTLLPAVLPLFEAFLECLFANGVQLGRRVPYNVVSSAAFSGGGTAKNHKEPRNLGSLFV
jgi:hypothetical protein